jgi:hypothetical protein
MKQYWICTVILLPCLGCTSIGDIQSQSDGTYMVTAKTFNLKKYNKGAFGQSLDGAYKDAQVFCAQKIPGNTSQIISTHEGGLTGSNAEATVVFKCVRK